MSVNRGKQFEDKFKEQWVKCFPKTFVLRLYDQVSGYKVVSQNACDFLCFPKGHLFMVECKSHDGASMSFDDIPQYNRLLQYKNLENVHPGILI